MAAIVATTAFVLGSSSGVVAQIHPGNYFTKSKTAGVASGTNVARSVKCPTGDRALTGGAYWHRTGQNGDPSLKAAIFSMAPTLDGRGWYATGGNRVAETLDFTVTVQCLPGPSVGAYSLRRREVIVDPGRSGNADLKCASGQKVVMGGGVWHRPGHNPDPDLPALVTGSAPDNAGDGWSVAGRNEDSAALRLRVTTFCVPTATVGSGYHVKTFTHVMVVGERFEEYLTCPHNERALGGGEFWTYSPNLPEWNSDIHAAVLSSSVTADGKAWYASAWMTDPHVDQAGFNVQVICLPV
jgi:hypothetical protein